MDVLTPRDIDGLADRLVGPAALGAPRSWSGQPTAGDRFAAVRDRLSDRFRDRAPRRPRWSWIILTWPILAVVVGWLVLRHHGANRPETVALVGFTPLLAAPVLFSTLGAWRGNSTPLRVATALVTGTFVVTMNPASAIIGCDGSATAGDITVYTANVLEGGGRADGVAESILVNRADVFVLQEVTDSFLQGLLDNPRLVETYPYRSHDGLGRHGGRVIWSRWPLSGVVTERFVVSSLVSATVESPQGSFRLTDVHTQAPARDGRVGPWQAQFEQLQTIDTTTPSVMAGDFNATGDHRPFRDLLDRGWTDVHEPKGCGLGATWPVDPRIPTPFYRLDHILVTDHFEVRDVRFGDPAGSDHVPVVAELRLVPDSLRSRAVSSPLP